MVRQGFLGRLSNKDDAMAKNEAACDFFYRAKCKPRRVGGILRRRRVGLI